MTPSRLLKILGTSNKEMSLAEIVTIQHRSTGKIVNRETVRRAMSELRGLGAVEFRETTGAVRVWTLTPHGAGLLKAKTLSAAPGSPSSQPLQIVSPIASDSESGESNETNVIFPDDGGAYATPTPAPEPEPSLD